MLANWIKRIAGVLAVAAIAFAGYLVLQPRPIQVDLTTAERGPLEVAVQEDGTAQIRDVFRVSAPVSGQLQRIQIEPGDKAVKDQTIVASIQPPDPTLLDNRSRLELEATADAAKAAVGVAEADVTRAGSALLLAQANYDRADRLVVNGTITAAAMEKSTADLAGAQAQQKQAEATLQLRKSELASTQARLMLPGGGENGAFGLEPCVDVRAPIDGVVLQVLTKSEQVVAAGTPLVEIGDPKRVEILADLLSTDAVKVQPGAIAQIIDWGGGTVLAAKVRRLDPTAHTKVSALGIEEQRVNAVLDLVEPADSWQGLGHQYRVTVRIPTWSSSDVLRVPLGALFRSGSDWAVFRNVDGKAVLTIVKVGHQNLAAVEILGGLSAGDKLILHPSDRIENGVGIAARPAG